MNDKYGKPFKTREGGVMRLEVFFDNIKNIMLKKLEKNGNIASNERENIAKQVAVAAIKYGDLYNQAEKDYIFDVDRFTKFEGNTGPYILYTIVRLKSLLNKQKFIITNKSLILPKTDSEKDVMFIVTKFQSVIKYAYENVAPHKICSYVYELCNACNRFYHENNISAEHDLDRKESLLNLISFVKDILETSINLLGFSAPDKM